MRAETAAAYYDEPSVDAFRRKVEQGIYSKPTVQKNSGRTEVRPYKHSDFEQIATAIGIAVKPIADLEAQFEAAALWFPAG